MYCPVCFLNTMKMRSSGVVKLSFNGKSRNTSLFTYNLQKDSAEQLETKLREKVIDFFSFYASFANKTPIKNFEIYSADFTCSTGCKMNMLTTKLSVVGFLYTASTIKKVLKEEAKKFAIDVEEEITLS